MQCAGFRGLGNWGFLNSLLAGFFVYLILMYTLGKNKVGVIGEVTEE